MEGTYKDERTSWGIGAEPEGSSVLTTYALLSDVLLEKMPLQQTFSRSDASSDIAIYQLSLLAS